MKRVLLLCSIISLGAANAVIKTENEMRLELVEREQNQRIAELQEKINSLQGMSEEHDALVEQIAQLTQQLGANQQELEAKTRIIEQLTLEVDNNKSTIERQNDSIATFTQQVNQHIATINNKDGKIALLEEQAQESKQSIISKAKEITQLTQQLGANQQELEAKTRIIEQLTQEINRDQATIDNKDSEISRLSSQLTTHRQVIEEKTEQINTQTMQLTQKQFEINDQANIINDLGQNIETLQQQLVASQLYNAEQEEKIAILSGLKDKIITTQGIISKIHMKHEEARQQFHALQNGVHDLMLKWFQTDKNDTIFVPYKPNKINEKDCSDVLLCIPLYQRLAGYGMATYYRSVFAKMFIEKLKEKAGADIFDVTNEEPGQHAKERQIFRGIIEELVKQGAPIELANEACRNSGSEFTISKYISSDILYNDVGDAHRLAPDLRALIGYRLCLLAVLVESAERGTIGLINGEKHSAVDSSGCSYSSTALIKADITQRKEERCRCFYKTPRGYDGHTLWAMLAAIEGVLCGKLNIPTP